MGNHDRVTEEAVEVVQIMPQERVQNRTVVQIIEFVHCILMERILERVIEQIVDMREPQAMEKFVKIPKITQQVGNTQYQLLTVSRQDPAANHTCPASRRHNGGEASQKFSRKQCRERIQSSECEVEQMIELVVHTVKVERPKIIKITVQRNESF